MSVSIYKFTDICGYLNALYEFKKSQNSLFSLRSWSKKLGYENHSFLVQCLKGQRRFNKKLVNAIAKEEGFENNQTEYLYTLLYKSMAEQDDFELFNRFLNFIKGPEVKEGLKEEALA